MARSFRVYQKKRGHRRTGSPKLGSVGETLFFAGLFLLGCAGLVLLFVTLVVPEWRANTQFVETRCTVLGTRIQEIAGKNGPLYRPEIQIRYEVRGATYVDWVYDVRREYTPGLSDKQEILGRVAEGAEYRCWYDPAQPGVAVLVRGLSWWTWLMFIVPLSFLLIGGGGFLYRLLHLGTSAERRSALAKRAASLELFDPGGAELGRYPHMPDSAAITDSPGTTLAFRLPVGSSAAWLLFWLAVACVFANGIVSVFVVVAIDSLREGHADWWLIVAIVPFVLGGIAMLVYFVRQLVITTGIGPTLVEISHHPLRPGGTYKLFLSQSGRLRVKSLGLVLECDEAAAFRQGTNTRLESCCVFRRQVFRRENFEIHSGMPFEVQCDLEVPLRAMHSFKAEHNEVNWKLIVKGDLAGWPPFERAFPVVVYPAAPAAGAAPAEAETADAASKVSGKSNGTADHDGPGRNGAGAASARGLIPGSAQA